MSKAMRGALAILVLLLIVSVGLAVYTLIQKQNLDQQNQSLQAQITDDQTKQTQLQTKLTKTQKEIEKQQQDFKDQLSQVNKAKDELQKSYEDIKTKSEDLNNQISQVTQDRDDWKSRLETIRKERDTLVEKLKHPKVKIVYRDRPAAAKTADQAAAGSQYSAPVTSASTSATVQGDQYWAQVLKEKAAVQLDLQKARSDLDQSAIQVVELKKQYADLKMEMKNTEDAKQDVEHKMQEAQQEFERKLKYSEDLANNISIEVARARNDQRTSNDRADHLKQENLDLQSQIKQLGTTKLALERTIAQINEDKVKTEKKLAQTEGTIQSRISEIWQIKDNLNKKISELPAKSSEVELPPIIVNASGNGQGPVQTAPPVTSSPGSKDQGSIISINEPNNFVIVDLGEGDGSQVGRPMTVFRGEKPIGNLEVIQVRKDISAADIKQNSIKLKVGDIVRY